MTLEPPILKPTSLEQALAESEQRYERLLAAASDYVFSVNLDHGVTSTKHGAGCEAITGYSPAEYSDDPYLWYRVIHDEDRAMVLSQIDLILHDKTVPTPLEHRITHKNGSVRWIRNTTMPRHNNEGHLLGYDGLITDITEKILAQNALRESEARVRMATEAAGIAVWDWNVNTNAIKWDQKMFELYGLPPTSEGWVNYKDWADRVLPSELAAQAAQLQQTVTTGRQSEREFHIVRASDHSLRVIQAAEMAVAGSDGKTERIVGMNIDITERKEAETRLQKANAKLIERGKVLNQLVRSLQRSHRQLKETQLQLIQSAKLESLGTLAAGVAHEVKNPLQTILLGLDYLGNQPTQADKNIEQVLNDMREAVNRANNIILELLSLSANSDFHIVPMSPNDLIDRALMLTKNLLTNSHITLHRELSSGLPDVLVDPRKLEQVLINVFINGIQAMEPGGTLTVRSRRLQVDEGTAHEPILCKFKPGETLVVVEVQDTGHGLTEDVLLKVFDPFFTTKPVGLGTGLGLSVTKTIVEEHGGNIEIKNAPGGGAVVVIALKTERQNYEK